MAMSICKQRELLPINRSSLYYRSLGEFPENFKLMKLLDIHATEFPSEGALSKV